MNVFIDEIYCDEIYYSVSRNRNIRINQIDSIDETVADEVGNWYNVNDLRTVDKG